LKGLVYLIKLISLFGKILLSVCLIAEIQRAEKKPNAVGNAISTNA